MPVILLKWCNTAFTSHLKMSCCLRFHRTFLLGATTRPVLLLPLTRMSYKGLRGFKTLQSFSNNSFQGLASNCSFFHTLSTSISPCAWVIGSYFSLFILLLPLFLHKPYDNCLLLSIVVILCFVVIIIGREAASSLCIFPNIILLLQIRAGLLLHGYLYSWACLGVCVKDPAALRAISPS